MTLPKNFTELTKYLYKLVTKEGQRRNADDVPIPWLQTTQDTKAIWRADVIQIWQIGESNHPLPWARDMLEKETATIKKEIEERGKRRV